MLSDPSEPTSSVVCRNDMEPPSIEYDPSLTDGVVARAGDTIKFSCSFYGKPQPTVSWMKDSNALQANQRVKVQTSATYTSIAIKDSSRYDTGICQLYLLHPCRLLS